MLPCRMPFSSFEYDKFVHILDLEGNSMELWEGNNEAYGKIANARIK
ncbi:MAG: hypothetical protein JWP37_1855 [Mucilaginibacter sp.]|nr:hypothetical protein [Mucilaginibacter sp.]